VSRSTILVLHLAGQYPLGGIGWQAIHHLVGLQRLGHDVYYVEDSGAPPYDPHARKLAEDPSSTVAALARTMERIGFGERWAYHDVSGGRCYGTSLARLRELYRRADALLNVCGATWLREEHLRVPLRLYVQTDPVLDQVKVARGERSAISALEAHTHGRIGDALEGFLRALEVAAESDRETPPYVAEVAATARGRWVARSTSQRAKRGASSAFEK